MKAKLSPHIVLDGPGLTEGGQIDVTITVHATIAVNAETARRKVTGWLVSEVGNLMIGGDPALVIADRAVWHVPVLLTSPARSIIGPIGAVDVDAETGEILFDSELSQELIERGRQTARASSSARE
jgi:hypothetical protein